MFPAGTFPQVPINDKKMYPIYAKCVELGIAGVLLRRRARPAAAMARQQVELIDEVCYDFPELVFVTRHGCEPWADLAVKLMLKWPDLHYSTSAFAPKHYPKAIIDYANTRGADKIIYAGYFPMGLSLERIMTELPEVQFKDEVWPKFLRHNAEKVLGAADGPSCQSLMPGRAASLGDRSVPAGRPPSRLRSARAGVSSNRAPPRRVSADAAGCRRGRVRPGRARRCRSPRPV